jgi:hypothetical protein
MPRPIKYAWALGLSALLLLSMSLEKGSPLLPIINGLIDMVQQGQIKPADK